MRMIDPKNPANRLYVSDFVIEQMQKIPTIEAEPVKHGRWVSIADKPYMIYECSLCNDRWSYGAVIQMNYCPNCGAKMDRGAENE